MTDGDWQAVARIYAEGIGTGIATFETQVPDYGAWDKAHLQAGRLVAEADGNILGWTALSPVSSRCVYGGVAEVSVYVSQEARGKGIGKLLMEKLISESEKAGYWTIQSGIFPQNQASISLHEKVGFRKIGYRERIGKMDDIWYDNVLMERRSKTVGN